MPKIYETSEEAIQDFLKTRWYKANYEMAKRAVLSVIEEMGYQVSFINDDYGEVFVETQNFDLTLTIFAFDGAETSVDMYMDSRILFDFGKSKKIINEFYNLLSKKISFKGLSLHK